MGILDETAFVERLRFFDGQQLFGQDLQAIETFNREMRWLHNQSLHQPGIGRGLAVYGKRDGREVRVGPGYAIDALGREIVLTRERVEPVPPVASEQEGLSVFFDLAISYPADELLEESETREGLCLPRGVVRLREEPVLCWIRLRRDPAGRLSPEDARLRQEVQDGLRIVLARVEVLECRLRQDVSLAERRSARPSRQPYLACGRQRLTWEETAVGDNDVLFLLAAEVDTAAAGFQSTPCYSVRLAGERVRAAGEEGEEGEEGGAFLVFDAHPSVVEPHPGGFRLEVLVTVFQGADLRPWNDWQAVWMGIE